MKNKRNLAELFLTKCFLVIMAIVFFVLTYYSFFYSYLEISYEQEKFMNYKDNIMGNLIGIIFVCAIVTCLIDVGKKLPEKALKVFFASVLGISTVFGFYWFSCHEWIPDADQYMIHCVAEMVSNNDYGSFVKWGYAAVYQHQWGLIFFMEILYRIFGVTDYNIFIVINILMIPVIIGCGYYIVSKITDHNKSAQVVYLMFMLLCLPMYGYIPQVYGEMVSVGAIYVSTAIILSLIDQFKIWKMLLAAGAMAFAVQARQNSLIYVIAVMIVLLLMALFRKNWKLLLTACLCVACILLSSKVVRYRYEPFASEECVNMPSILWVAMGLHDSPEGPGWFDGSSTEVFIYQTDFDVDESTKIAIEDIKLSLKRYMMEPDQGVDFLRRKILSQWNAPMYQTYGSNYINVQEEAHGLVRWLYFDEGKVFSESFMNLYQLITYAGVCLYSIWSVKNKNKLEENLLLITVFGGFLFTMIWEAKARYIFPYFMFLLPHAVSGLNWIILQVVDYVGKHKQRC